MNQTEAFDFLHHDEKILLHTIRLLSKVLIFFLSEKHFFSKNNFSTSLLHDYVLIFSIPIIGGYKYNMYFTLIVILCI